MKVCEDGRIWGQTNKEAGTHLGTLRTNYPGRYDPQYYQENRDKLRATFRNYYNQHKEQISKRSKLWHQANRGRVLVRRRELDRLLKYEVLTRYSMRDFPQCTICGISDIDVLNIDHIENGGRKHGESISGGALGQNLYRWLKRNDYPRGFQSLCANCNLKKEIERKRKNRSKV